MPLSVWIAILEDSQAAAVVIHHFNLKTAFVLVTFYSKSFAFASFLMISIDINVSESFASSFVSLGYVKESYV